MMVRSEQPSFFFFAFGGLARRPFRTAALIFLVSVLAFVLFAGSLISLSLRSGTDTLSRRLGADLLVVPQGYEQRTKGILLGGEPSVFYMDASWARKIPAIRGVRAASPQLFVASLSSSCCAQSVQMIGFDQATDFTVGPWIQTAFSGTLSMDEIVIGEEVSGSVGGRLKFLGRSYTVAAKMDRTGTGFDNSVFMSLEAAKRAADDYVKTIGGAKVPAGAVSSVTVQLQKGYSAADVVENISGEAESADRKISVISAEQLVGGLSSDLRSAVGFAAAFAALFWLVSVLVLAVVFAAALQERKRELGLLRSLGATKGRLASLVLLQSGGISLFGGALGIGFGFLVLIPFRAFLQQSLNMPYLQPSGIQLAVIACASLLLAFVTGPVASLACVVRICRDDACLAIREGGA